MSNGNVPPELDRMVDKVLGLDPKGKAIPEVDDTTPTVTTWSTSITDIFENAEVRLDATHYDPLAASALRELENSGLELKPLSEWATVVLPSQFTRVWAKDERHGIPYLNATDLLSLLSLGVPSKGMRYLSHATDTNLDRLVIHEGWLLMSCSGTIGRVFYVPQRFAGWVATHDLIRIIPNDPKTVGFLHTWLTTPLAQAQIFSHTHGGQIDHITDDQIAKILVPSFPSKDIEQIHKETMKALRARERALETLLNAEEQTKGALPQ